MNVQWIENARAEFVRIYGPKRGPAVCGAVMPGVTGDFRRTVLAAEEGRVLRERYRIDDMRADVVMTGHRRGDVCVVTGIEIGGVPVGLGAEELVLALLP